MSFNKLDETLSNLDLDSAAKELKDEIISKSMNTLKEKMSGLDIQVEKTENEVQVERKQNVYEADRTKLADTARSVYRANINPVDKKAVEKKAGKDEPSTIAQRANVTAIARSLAGMRSSGNEGKTSFVGPNGSGNVGKLSPTGANGIGNVSNQYDNYYALTTDMTLEEYEAYVDGIFNEGDCGMEKAEKTKKEIAARGGPPGKPDPSVKKEDIVYELESRLVTMGSTDWVVVDQILREFAQELDVAPRTLSREFKSIHGVYPDKWIKENLDVEVCGYMPLEEAARLNKVGTVYEVTFMYRGGTNRLKFFWPMPGQATKEDMQREVEKFWPKARLLAYYPTIDNEQQSNYMVMAPPMTENYYFLQPDVWHALSEEMSEMLEFIYEEEGEPISPILNEDNGVSVYVEDHETGDERKITITEEGLRDWFGKSKSKDGKKGWVNVVTGDSCASDKPGEGIPKCVSSAKRASMSKKERLAAAAAKRREDPGQQSKRGASKPTNVKTDRNVKEEVISEESDKKGKKSGTKDACYHKVKSRYSVWPSAYASGALVKCRKVGAANWGNSSKKEEVEFYTPGESDPSTVDEACWKGYEKKGMKTMFGKRYPNCVKKTKSEEVEHVDEACWSTHEQRGMKKKGDKMVPNCVPKGSVSEAANAAQQAAIAINMKKQGKKPKDTVSESMYGVPLANPADTRANRYRQTKVRESEYDKANKSAEDQKKKEAQAYEKNMSKLNNSYDFQEFSDYLTEKGDMSGMSVKSGDKRSTESGAGLTQKGVEKYRRQNPGSKLKTAVTTPPSKLKPGSKAAKRRKSFCARSRGWTGERGKAARRRWNC